MSVLLLLSLLVQPATEQATPSNRPAESPEQSIDQFELRESGLTAGEAMAAEKISQAVTATEFLGPLAPVALSPFFGVACLSGMAAFGPDSLGSNALISDSSPLASPWVFAVFAVLATLTSLPRLTKVSKPIAGALDQVEAWSGIITMIVVKFLIGGAGSDLEVAGSHAVQVAGIGQLSIDALLAIAAGVNIFVVNSVKFFFEFLIWITPVPFLDACFEAANKALCLGLWHFAIHQFVHAFRLRPIPVP